MTHTYTVSGMTCSGCSAKVEKLLAGIQNVQNVSVDLPKGEAAIEMATHIPTAQLKAVLKDYPKYQLAEKQAVHQTTSVSAEEIKSWLATYKPILIVFAFITGITFFAQIANGGFDWNVWMRYFMAGFFLVFSFFKLLNLGGFAESYAMYDIVAKKWNGWGYVYAFIELALGIAYLVNFNPLLTNAITLVVMSVSIIGVLQSVLNKRKIKCACLGDVFNLPMSTVTIIEDGLMILMSLVTILTFA